MRILLVNAVCGIGSTGRICTDIHDLLKQKGNECKIAFAHSNPIRIEKEDTFRINGIKGYYLHNAISHLTDRAGFYSTKATKSFIEWVEQYQPDIIHLHNLHGYYINIKLLFDFIRVSKIPTVWTLHDCWAFTGHCTHYSYINCDKWKNCCKKCKQKKEYPSSFVFDQSERNYFEKRELFTSLENLTLTTPSYWLASQVKQSYLKKFPVHPIYNGIDLEIFAPHKTNIFCDLGIKPEQRVLLSVANEWTDRKGYNDLIKLSYLLDNEKYKLVMIGVNPKIKRKIPSSIVTIERTQNLNELVKLYSSAYAFINPSYEETMGMVTAEALACGTPAIVYNRTAVPEVVDYKSGIIVKCGDIKGIKDALWNIGDFKSEDCIRRAETFERNKQYSKYYNLYKEILEDGI